MDTSEGSILEPAAPLEFCLLRSLGVRPIALEPRVEDQPHIPNPRHVALSSAAVARRREQIAQTAVTFPNLLALEAGPSTPTRVYKPTSVTKGGDLPAFLVTERIRPVKPSRFGRLSASPPPDRGLGGKMCCPTISMELVTEEDETAQTETLSKSQIRRRRAKAAKVKDRPVASFWAPPEGLGGKSEGYAFGYVGSEPGERERRAYWGSGWRRDRMKTGVERLRW